MEESLKTIRLIHNFLIGLCAAIIVFASAPNTSLKYKAALDQLSVVRQLPYEGYALFAHERILQVDRDDTLACQATSRKLKIPLSSTFSVHDAIFVVWPPDDATLEQLLYFFENKNQVYYFESACEAFTGPMTKTLQELWQGLTHSSGRNQYELSSISVMEPLETYRTNPQLPSFLLSTRPQAGKTKLQLVIDFASKDKDPQFRLTISEPISSYESNTLIVDTKEWIRSQPDADRSLITLAGGHATMFQNLKELSNQIGFMRPGQAASYLEEKLESTKGGISFLGLSIGERLLVWAGPLLILSILLFFFSHVHHLRKNVVRKDESIGTFPWIGIFDDRVSKALTRHSVLLLPALADLLVLYRTGHFPELATLGGSVLACVTVVLAMITIGEIETLQRSSS